MLVLARRVDGRINLHLQTEHGEKLLGTVMVVSVHGPTVRLGFEFGPEVRIAREELDDRPRVETKP
jgi:sRNA-binding carbon storage regulator CsrA